MDDRPELLPTAYLLTGGAAAARDLLVHGRLHGGGLDGLVRAHLRRRATREGVIAGTSGDPWWLTPADVAAARATGSALDGLSRPERTALVLRWHEGLDLDEVSRLVPGVDTAPLPDRLGVPAAELPRRLEGLAALADVRDLTDADVVAGARAVRRRRRSRALLAVGAVAVLGAGAAWLPGALPTAAPAATTGGASATAETGPPRGSLVDDDAFVTALRGRLDPGPDDGRLVYAGDVDDRRWVLFVRSTDAGPSAYWFTGPAGADPAGMLLSGTTFGTGPGPAAWSISVGTPEGTSVFVVAAPGDEVQVSPGLVVAADGTTSQTFAPADTQDGVAATALPDIAGPPALTYRLVRDDVVVATEKPAIYVLDAAGPAAPVDDPGGPRSGPGPVSRAAYDAAVEQVVNRTGTRRVDLAVTVLGAGVYPAPGGVSAGAVTVAVTYPSGAVVTSTAWASVGPYDGAAGTCGVETHPAGTDLATLAVVTRCSAYATDASTFGATVLVVAPAGARVALASGAGGDVQTPALDAGWAYVVDGADDLTVFDVGGVQGTVSRAGAGPFA